MPVIEAQRASILVPHDHRHINQNRASVDSAGLVAAAAFALTRLVGLLASNGALFRRRRSRPVAGIFRHLGH
jgi:hypothetical protein